MGDAKRKEKMAPEEWTGHRTDIADGDPLCCKASSDGRDGAVRLYLYDHCGRDSAPANHPGSNFILMHLRRHSRISVQMA